MTLSKPADAAHMDHVEDGTRSQPFAIPGLAFVARYVYLVLFAVFLAAPLVVVTGVSLNSTRRMSFPPEQTSLHWYGVFFSDPAWLEAFRSSLLIAILSSLMAMSLALPLAYAVWKYNSRFSKLLSALGTTPFMLPAVVVSVVYLIFWDWIGHPGKIEDIVMSHGVVFLAVPLVSVNLGFRLIDRSLIEAAGTLGASEATVFRTIVLPLILPYIVSGLIFVFVLSLNEYVIAYMVAGLSVETLPIKVFNSLRLGFEPTMCVGATLFMLVGTAAFSAVALLGDLPKLLGAEGK
ncbi:MAG TPA: ABC transporter permease [Aliidongia sp.]|nr:ABC transporter permease [Aliidongia sp.]